MLFLTSLKLKLLVNRKTNLQSNQAKSKTSLFFRNEERCTASNTFYCDEQIYLFCCFPLTNYISTFALIFPYNYGIMRYISI